MSYTVSTEPDYIEYENCEEYKPACYSVEGIRIKSVPIELINQLRNHVAKIFYAETVKPGVCMMPIVPDGCNTIVVIAGKENTNAFVCGNIDEIRKIEIHPDERVFFIKLKPGVGYSLFEGKSDRIANHVIKLEECITEFEQVKFAASNGVSPSKFIDMVCTTLKTKIIKEKHEYLIKFCTDKIIRNSGNVSVSNLAKDSGFTERHISKMFDSYVGLSPKSFSQIIRLQGSMKTLLSGIKKPIADVAIAYGFFDHAHMNRVYNKYIHRSAGNFGHSCFNGIDYNEIDKYVEEI